jgi:hypothetical protein
MVDLKIYLEVIHLTSCSLKRMKCCWKNIDDCIGHQNLIIKRDKRSLVDNPERCGGKIN